MGAHAAVVRAVLILDEVAARDSPGPGYTQGAGWSSDWKSSVAAAAERISNCAASFGFLHTRHLAAGPAGEGELSFEMLASVEAVAAVTEAIAIAAEGRRLPAVAVVAPVNIDDVDPSFAELTLVSAQSDKEGFEG